MISMISTAIGDTCISLAGNYIQSRFCNYVSSIKWNDLFVKVKNALIDSYEKDEVIIKTIEIVLDNNKLKRLEEKYKNYRDVKLIDSIQNDIRFSFRKYTDDEKFVDELVDRFIDALLFHIRTYDSDLYNNICFYQEMLKTEEHVRLLVEKDKEITFSACSLWQVEDRLRKGNKYNIDLDFFDYDEQEVDDSIIQELKNKSVIYIKAEDQEEGLLYLLRLFKNIPNLCDNVMIIKDEASWEWADKLLRGKILIPLFESTQITPSQQSKTIIVLPSNNPYYNDNCITIPKRTVSNMRNKLSEYIIEDYVIDRLIRNKAFNFQALKNNLFEGKMQEPSWFKNTNNPGIFAPALLVGKWNEGKEDTTVLEYLSNMSYEDYILKINELTKNGDYFINNYNEYRNKLYYVIDLKTSWYTLFKFIKKDVFESFSSVFKEIVLDEDTKIEYGIQLANCGTYSTELKNGVVISLVYMSIVAERQNKCIQYEVVNKCLDSLFGESNLNEHQWSTICSILPILIEANPKYIIDILIKEFSDNCSKIHSLFERKGNGLYHYDSYPSLLFAIEKALFYEDTYILAIKLLQILCEENMNPQLVNSPFHSLSRVFSPIMDEIGLGIENRKTLLKSFLETDKENCWKILTKILPSRLGTHYEYLRKPDYKIPNYNTSMLSLDEKNRVYRAYMDIAFECADGDLVKLGYILNNTMLIEYGYLSKFITCVSSVVSDDRIPDKDKYQFAVIVRSFIYNCRFHKVKRYDEEIVRQIEENIYAKIKYSNNIYNVLYYFESSYTPLTPGEIIDNKEEVSTQWDRKEKAQENKQIEILRSYFKENMQKLDELLELVQDNQQIGISIAKSLDYKLDRNIIEILHKHKKHAILLLYIRNVIFSMETRDAIESISSTFAGFDMETRFLALSSLAIDDITIKYVDSLAEEERNYYYLNVNSYVKDLKRESLKEYFTNLLKARNYEGIRILMLNNDLELVDYINLLKSYASYDDNKGNPPLRDYELTKIFKNIYEVDHIPENLVEDIILLEIVYFRILYSAYERIKPQFLINKLFNDAGYLVQIINITFFTDQDEKRECTDEEPKAIKFYDYLIRHIHFCPCVDTNNQYHPEKWSKWIKDFIEGVTKNNQINVGLKILGRFFSYFPKGNFPGWLPEEICQLIDNYNDAGLKHFFFIQCINNRPAHYCNHGSEDIPLIEEYKHYAEALSIKYPITASIFRKLANHYNSEKQQKREQASHTVY